MSEKELATVPQTTMWTDINESEPCVDEMVIGWDWQANEAVCVAYMQDHEFVGVAASPDNDIQIYHYTRGTITHFQKMPTSPFTSEPVSGLTTH
tara:strand:- start:590 stop:871 length:282 start_codon:yes stop_codon:yes gene_type:complete